MVIFIRNARIYKVQNWDLRNSSLDTLKKHFTRLKTKKIPGQTLKEVFQQELDEDSFPAFPSPNIKTHDFS